MEDFGAEGLEGGTGAPGVGGEAGLEGEVRQGRGEVPVLLGRDEAVLDPRAVARREDDGALERPAAPTPSSHSSATRRIFGSAPGSMMNPVMLMSNWL